MDTDDCIRCEGCGMILTEDTIAFGPDGDAVYLCEKCTAEHMKDVRVEANHKVAPMEQKWYSEGGDSYWVFSDDGEPIWSLVHIENDHERIDMCDRIVADHNKALLWNEKDAEIAALTEVNAHLTVCVANLEQLPRYILARFRSGKLHDMAYGLRNYKLEADHD